MTKRALDGIRVMDHGHVWAGPLLGAMFAEMGADVLKITSPTRTSGVSMAGTAGAMGADPDRDPDALDPMEYHGYDRSKRAIAIDLSRPEGVDLYKRLIAKTDVVFDNFSPRVMPSLGLGFDSLSAVNPGLVMCSLSATGATDGPWRELLTYGPSLGALYGLKSVQGYHDDPRPREDRADLDPTAAGHAFFVILAALDHRDRTGQGQFIDLSQGECALQRLAEPVVDYFMNGRVAGPQGNRYAGIAPHGIYPSAGDDEWIAIVARDDDEWAALIECAVAKGAAAEILAGLRDQRFAGRAGRLQHQDDLDDAVAAWTATVPGDELAASLQDVGVPAHIQAGPPSLLEDTNIQAVRHAGVELETSQITLDQIFQGIPWKLPKNPGVITSGSPLPGADTGDVLQGILGMSQDEVAGLAEAGVI